MLMTAARSVARQGIARETTVYLGRCSPLTINAMLLCGPSSIAVTHHAVGLRLGVRSASWSLGGCRAPVAANSSPIFLTKCSTTLCGAGQHSSRAFSSPAAGQSSLPPEDSKPVPPTVEPPEPSGSSLVDSLNMALYKHPLTTSLVFLYHNVALASVLYGVFTVAGISPPAELGIAFAINRVTTRLRLPIILALAAGLSKLKPAYSKLQLSKLMTAPFTTAVEDAKQQMILRGEREPGLSLRFHEMMLKAVNVLNMGGVIDKFGLSYVLCGRAVATCSILGIFTALRLGLDVTPLLEFVGESGSTAADWMSRWTVGCLIINATYPLVLRHFVADFSMALGDLIARTKTTE